MQKFSDSCSNLPQFSGKVKAYYYPRFNWPLYWEPTTTPSYEDFIQFFYDFLQFFSIN